MTHIFSLFALLFCSLVFAADKPMPSREELRVMQVTQDACVAFLKADLAAAEALLAPGFTLVNSSAVVQTREEVLAEIRNGDPQYDEFRNHSMTARVFGDAAIGHHYGERQIRRAGLRCERALHGHIDS